VKNILFYGLLMTVLAGCSREEVQTYQAPKEPTAAASVQAPATSMGSASDNEAVLAAHAAMTAQAPAETGFKATLPEGWTENPGSGMRKVSYAIEGTSIDFYLTSLSTGDVMSNVNRWRGQVGLAPAAPEEIAKDAETIKVEGHTASYSELYNVEGGKGIIASIIDLAPNYWYFTAKGSNDELKANAAGIRAFLESIKFEGHSH
jgi:hypothetical protein